MDSAPKRLRRMTVDEAHLLQTFPSDFKFLGSKSSVFRQIGNAVPCNLAESVANLTVAILDGKLGTPICNKGENFELSIE